MKLTKQIRKYNLRGNEIEVYSIPAFEAKKFLTKFSTVKENEKAEMTLDLFCDFIYEYTELKNENTKDEIKEYLGYDEVMDLGNFILNAEKLDKKNFTKS